MKRLIKAIWILKSQIANHDQRLQQVLLLVLLFLLLLAQAVGIPVGRRSSHPAFQWLTSKSNRGHYFQHNFHSFFPMSFPSSNFLIGEVCGSNSYLAKFAGSAKNLKCKHLSKPCQPFWYPLAAILYFAGGVALQVVSNSSQCHQAGISIAKLNSNLNFNFN